MASPIVRSGGPTDHYAEIRSWRSYGYLIALKDTGNRTAKIVCTHPGSEAETYGHIHFSTERDRYFVEWNATGKDALEEYRRNAWDTKFYTAMAAWERS